MPRRRRGARAVAVEAEAERGLAMRILLHSPKDLVAGLLAFAAVSAIVANALFLQAGHHPSPMFGSVVAMPAAGSAPPVRCRVRARSSSQPSPPTPHCRNSSLSSPNLPSSSRSRSNLPSRKPPSPKLPIRSPIWSRRPPPRRRRPAFRGRRRQSRLRRTRRAPRGGGAARAHGIWLWPVEADRHGRFRHPGRDPEVRARAQAAGDRADVRSPGARPRRDDRPPDRLAFE